MHERIAAEIERIERKYPSPMIEGGGVRPARPFPLRHSAGRPDDGHRQQFPGGLALELLRHRPQASGRLVRRHFPHGRGAGAADETARRRGTRPFAHPSHGQSGAQLGAHLDRYRALHGAVFELDARGGAGRPPRRADALALDQAPRRRAVHRRQGGHGQGDGRQRLDQDRRRIHACGAVRQEIPPAVPDQRRTIRNTSRTSTRRNSGRRSSTMPGSRPSRACCSGIRSCARACPTAMPTRASATVSTNPCGEIPLCPYDSCRLLALNLFSYVDNPFTGRCEVRLRPVPRRTWARRCT